MCTSISYISYEPDVNFFFYSSDDTKERTLHTSYGSSTYFYFFLYGKNESCHFLKICGYVIIFIYAFGFAVIFQNDFVSRVK